MKRKLIYIFSVILLILIPIRIKAFSGNVVLSCDKNKLGAGESTVCHVSGNASDGVVYAAEFNVSAGANLVISEPTVTGSWDGDGSGNHFELYTDRDMPGSFTLGSFKITASDIVNVDTSVTVSNVEYTYKHSCDANNSCKLESAVVSGKTIPIRIVSDVNTISSIKVNGQDVQVGGKIVVDAATANVTAVATSPATVTGGTGVINLNYGDNSVNIVVRAESGSTKTYTITITRPDSRSNNNYLKSINLSKGSIKFNRSTTNYNVEVDSDVEEISITGVVDDDKATVTGNGVKKLKLGRNSYKLVVTAENGATKTYTITVNRKDNRSSENDLKSLSDSEGKIEFDKDKTDYEIVVDYEVEKMSFKAEAVDNKSKVAGLEERQLEVGTNIFNIRVTAENGNVKTYKVTVIRNKLVVETDSNKAKSIIIKDHDFEFDPAKTEYVLETRLHELDIKVEADPSSKVEITGNENIHDGSIVQVIITDKEGNNNIYTIKINNPVEEKNKAGISDWAIFKTPKYILYIVMFISIVVILILLVLVNREKAVIKKMLRHHKHHTDDSEVGSIDNSGLMGEPTYETLEMAKIDLEDYLTEERRAKHKKGIKESEEDIKNIRNELEEKIAILEEAENTITEIKKNADDTENDDKALDNDSNDTEAKVDNSEIENTDEENTSKKPQSRVAKRAAKKLDLIDIDGLVSEPEMKDDIDDLINNSKDTEKEETKGTTTRASKNKKKSSKVEEKEVKDEVVEKSTKEEKEHDKKDDKIIQEKVEETKNGSENTGTTKKKKKKNKKKKNDTTKSKKVANDELLDQILSKNYTSKKK